MGIQFFLLGIKRLIKLIAFIPVFIVYFFVVRPLVAGLDEKMEGY